MDIKQLVQQTGENAKSKGFHDALQNDNPGTIGTLLMLIVSEASEALEAERKGKRANLKEFEEREKQIIESYRGIASGLDNTDFINLFENRIKDTFEDEIADTIIRLADLCYRYNIDIETHIELKHRYNTTREKLHGKKY